MHHIDAPIKSLSIGTSAPASRLKETSIFKLHIPCFAPTDMNPTITPHSNGPMGNVCLDRSALRFIDEHLNCCHNGKITLPELRIIS